MTEKLNALKICAAYDVEQLLMKEFPKLRDQHYVDHAASTLYSRSQIKNIFNELDLSLLGNPHSRHQPSDVTTQAVDAVRHRILEHFNTTAENYDVIFTSGATAALKLVAEYFDWTKDDATKQTNELGNECSDSYRDRNSDRNCKDVKNEGDCLGDNVSKQSNRSENVIKRSGYESRNSNANECRNSDTNECRNCRDLSNERDCLEDDATKQKNRSGNVRNRSGDECRNSDRTCKDLSNERDCLEDGATKHRNESGNECRDWNIAAGRNECMNERDGYICECRDSNRNECINCKDVNISCINGVFIYGRENHSSVLGMRGPAHKSGCTVYSVTTKELQDILDRYPHNNIQKYTEKQQDALCKNRRVNCVFAYSGQCNFSGSKSPLNWVEKVHNGALNNILHTSPINNTTQNTGGFDKKWFVVLDAASLVATSPLDLSTFKPDFVPISFYKMFGYPTGLGCLLVSRRAWGYMKKEYYGGGTVLMADSTNMTVIPRNTLHERFEDGTVDFLSIIAVRHGLDTLTSIPGGMMSIQSHTYNLACYTHHYLKSLRHSNGNPVCVLYGQEEGEWDKQTHGSIVNFNILNSDGTYIGYSQVERVASLYNIHLRTGCLCNPGACQTYLNISSQQLHHQFEAGHVCGDTHDLVDGLPTGSVRVSFGYMSVYEDAEQVLRMVKECFIQGDHILDTNWMTQTEFNSKIQDQKAVSNPTKIASDSDLTIQDRETGSNHSKIQDRQIESHSNIQDKAASNLTKIASNSDFKTQDRETGPNHSKIQDRETGLNHFKIQDNNAVSNLTKITSDSDLKIQDIETGRNHSKIQDTNGSKIHETRYTIRQHREMASNSMFQDMLEDVINGNTVHNTFNNENLVTQEESTEINDKYMTNKIKETPIDFISQKDIEPVKENKEEKLTEKQAIEEKVIERDENKEKVIERDENKEEKVIERDENKEKVIERDENKEKVIEKPKIGDLKLTETQKIGDLKISEKEKIEEKVIIEKNETKQEKLRENERIGALRLTDILIYPVKSCGAMRVNNWGICDVGLIYDRTWMIVTKSGVTLTQKKLPQMALITPYIDLNNHSLVLSYQGFRDMSVSLTPEDDDNIEVGVVCGGRVCGDRVKGYDCGDDIALWLCTVLQLPDVRLMRQSKHRTSRLKSQTHGVLGESLSLTNESQLLIIHRPSIRHLLQNIKERGIECDLTEDELVMRFRANLVTDADCNNYFEEDSWTNITIDNITLKVQGSCRRCQMVCVSPSTGQRTREPLLTISSMRGTSVTFGVHASIQHEYQQNTLLSTNASVYANVG